jgi:predicted PurR-regulated permease PerM
VATRSTTASWQRAFLISGSLILIVGALYVCRSVLIPVVLAVLLAFVLNPLVVSMQRRVLPRIPSVLLSLVLALTLIGAIGYAVATQVRSLLDDLPQHKDEIAAKLFELRQATQGSVFEQINGTVQDIEDQINELAKEHSQENETDTGSNTENSPEAKKRRREQPAPTPIPVRVESSSFPMVQSVAGSVAESLVAAVLVLALVAFMLIKREDLRNRIIRLWGNGSVTSMTRALDDASTRISRFLLMQLIVNSCFGVCTAIGLWFIGVPYPVLWGFLGTCLRYIPYVGPWVAASFPLLVSVALLPGWKAPVMVFCLYLALELFISQAIEPLVYGQSIGVSEVALLIAAAFWTWLWGPLGLVLSTPLTACLAVMGRYVPQLEFFHILLGDEPALQPYLTYYQRLLARDEDEAAELIEDYMQSHDSETVFDEVLVPALSLARRNRERDQLTDADEEFMLRVAREQLSEVLLPTDAKTADSNRQDVSCITVFGCPARDEMDELSLEMLQRLLDPGRCSFEVISPDSLTAEVVAKVQAEQAPVVCIGTLPPQSLAHTRYLCKRLRRHFPDLKILVGCWGWEGSRERIEERLKAAGADLMATSLLEARDLLRPLVQVLKHTEPASSLARTA